MKPRVRQLRALLHDGMYTIDERKIADAILARAAIREMVPGIEFAQDRSAIRSFRNDPSARSFRLSSSRRRTVH